MSSTITADDLAAQARHLLDQCRERSLALALAESCTGGLIAASITDVAGASDVFDRGFVTYSNEAKMEMLGVRLELLVQHGAVSRQVAQAMAEGALVHSRADVAAAVTGVAGPGGGSEQKPVGLVHIAAARIGVPTIHIEKRYGPLARGVIRRLAARDALALARKIVETPGQGMSE